MPLTIVFPTVIAKSVLKKLAFEPFKTIYITRCRLLKAKEYFYFLLIARNFSIYLGILSTMSW
jgi:heme oxygenase